jgi:Asp-tRNA(Asn)/Glu-tRNA(Gln) amidotransferase A subunit family amidase
VGQFTNRPDNSLVDVHSEVRNRGVHALLDRLAARFAADDPARRHLVVQPDRFARLRQQADALLATHPRPELRPFLFGVPVVVEEELQVEDLAAHARRLPSAGLPAAESEVVTRLRAEGALVLGRTVRAETGHRAPGSAAPGAADLAPRAGTPSFGLHQGCAVAVAAGLCPLAVAVQTSGAVLASAADQGVVAFKPSRGRISTRGVIPLAPSLDQCAILTVDVESACVAASILCSERIYAVSSRRPALAIPEGPYLAQVSADRLAHFRDTCDWLSGRYRVRSLRALLRFDEVRGQHDRLLAAEAASADAARPLTSHDLSAPPQLGSLVARGQQDSPRQLRQVQSGRARLRARLAALMDRHRIDLWLSPATTGVASRALSPTGPQVMGIPWTHAGLPTLSLPAGRDAACLPVGLQIAGRWDADDEVLAWAGDIARLAAM